VREELLTLTQTLRTQMQTELLGSEWLDRIALQELPRPKLATEKPKSVAAAPAPRPPVVPQPQPVVYKAPEPVSTPQRSQPPAPAQDSELLLGGSPKHVVPSGCAAPGHEVQAGRRVHSQPCSMDEEAGAGDRGPPQAGRPALHVEDYLLGPVRQAMAKVAPHIAHLEQVPTEPHARCLLIDTGLPPEERQFLERLAQALTGRVAPAQLISIQQLGQRARPPVKLLVAFRGKLSTPTSLPLVELESAASYNDKSAKIALWKQLCQQLEK
jgi:hypothetical protein